MNAHEHRDGDEPDEEVQPKSPGYLFRYSGVRLHDSKARDQHRCVTEPEGGEGGEA